MLSISDCNSLVAIEYVVKIQKKIAQNFIKKYKHEDINLYFNHNYLINLFFMKIIEYFHLVTANYSRSIHSGIEMNFPPSLNERSSPANRRFTSTSAPTPPVNNNHSEMGDIGNDNYTTP